jgi:hypothetical protein
MRNLLRIVGLKPDGKIRTYYNRITRKHVILAELIFLSSLLITTFVQGIYLNRECLSAATHQLRFMDNSVLANRCIDFYNYASDG